MIMIFIYVIDNLHTRVRLRMRNVIVIIATDLSTGAARRYNTKSS